MDIINHSLHKENEKKYKIDHVFFIYISVVQCDPESIQVMQQYRYFEEN